MFPPERIVCLTEETVETLYLLGEQDRIVGISGYCVRPPQARREKPRVSAFTSADIPEDPRPAARPGPELLRPPGRHRRRADPAGRRCSRLQPAQHRGDFRHDPHAGGAGRRRRPRRPSCRGACGWTCRSSPTRRADAAAAPSVFRGMGRADDLRHCLGVGADRRRGRRSTSFAERASGKSAKERICHGRKRSSRASPTSSSARGAARSFAPEKVAARPGFDRIPAVRNDALHEIKSPLILQPGPAALTAGLAELQRVVEMAARG